MDSQKSTFAVSIRLERVPPDGMDGKADSARAFIDIRVCGDPRSFCVPCSVYEDYEYGGYSFVPDDPGDYLVLAAGESGTPLPLSALSAQEQLWSELGKAARAGMVLLRESAAQARFASVLSSIRGCGVAFP